jgi:hypothetical protein
MLFLIIFIIAKSALPLLAQDTLDCPVQNFDIPFEIKDDPNIRISFPENFFSKGVKGIAFAPVLVDGKGTLIKYCVNAIRIQDSTKKNSLVYTDYNMKLENINGISAEMPIEKYPYYIRFIVEEIYKKIKMIKFFSDKPVSAKKQYQFSVIFKME